MKRTTISLSEAVKKELLREMARLQLKWGRRVNFEDVIIHLVMQRRRRPELLEEACKPVEGIHPELVIEDLVEERKMDLEREERKAHRRGASKRQDSL